MNTKQLLTPIPIIFRYLKIKKCEIIITGIWQLKYLTPLKYYTRKYLKIILNEYAN